MNLRISLRAKATALRAILLLALGFTCRAGAQPSDTAPANLDAILQPIITKARIPGMAAVVLQGDRIVAQGAAGVRKKGGTEPITLADQFELCSCTKAMTATLVAMLIEDGKLGWNTSLAEIFAAAAPDIDSAWRTVTVRQLLAQRAGITGNHPFALLGSVSAAKDDVLRQRRAFAVKLLSQPPDIPPGTKFVYSATNFILAGAVLEAVTGRSWEELMRERLYGPLGIASGGFGPPGTAGQVDEPWGHGHRRLLYVPMPGWGDTPFDPGSDSADYPLAAGPAGMAHMSVADWAKFVALHLQGDPANPHRQVTLLKAETFAQLHEPEAGEKEYTGGWFIGTRPWAKGPRSSDTGRVLFHAGDNGRWSTVVWIAPEIDFALLIACNRGGMPGPVDEAAGALLRFAPKPNAVRSGLETTTIGPNHSAERSSRREEAGLR
jgi:D-alanyl-D-alanine carboxypeptidase